jgi:hypothetical protein
MPTITAALPTSHSLLNIHIRNTEIQIIDSFLPSEPEIGKRVRHGIFDDQVVLAQPLQPRGIEEQEEIIGVRLFCKPTFCRFKKRGKPLIILN